MDQCNNGIIEYWYNGIMVQWNNGMIELWTNGIQFFDVDIRVSPIDTYSTKYLKSIKLIFKNSNSHSKKFFNMQKSLGNLYLF